MGSSATRARVWAAVGGPKRSPVVGQNSIAEVESTRCPIDEATSRVRPMTIHGVEHERAWPAFLRGRRQDHRASADCALISLPKRESSSTATTPRGERSGGGGRRREAGQRRGRGRVG